MPRTNTSTHAATASTVRPANRPACARFPAMNAKHAPLIQPSRGRYSSLGEETAASSASMFEPPSVNSNRMIPAIAAR
mgnify:CR=1 FL=1